MNPIRSALDWLGWERLSETRKRHEQIIKIMATIQERLTTIETSIDEAGTELTAELTKLREQIANGTVTPEALETIGRLEAKAKALADIIPNEPPVEPAQ